MEHLMNLDVVLAMEVETTRAIVDDLLANARRNQVKTLYAMHQHERANRTWDRHIQAVSRIGWE